MFKWLFGLKENWKLVKTIKVEVEISTNRSTLAKKITNGKVYYHLFESSSGRRKVEYATDANQVDNLESAAKALGDYHNIVFPWLHGRFVPNIPDYNDVDAEDVLKKLSLP